MNITTEEKAAARASDQQYLKRTLRERAKRRAECFKAYALHNDNNATARRVLAGTSGNWYKRACGESVYLCDVWPKGWRDLGDCQQLAPRTIDHSGWYADSQQSALIRGRVLQLPARNGSPRYIAGTYCTECDGVTLYPLQRFDDARDAALYADECARVEADNARDADARDCAAALIEEAQDSIVNMRRACLALLREMRAVAPGRKTPIKSGEPTAICEVLRARVKRYQRDIKKARERVAALTENYWLAVEGC